MARDSWASPENATRSNGRNNLGSVRATGKVGATWEQGGPASTWAGQRSLSREHSTWAEFERWTADLHKDRGVEGWIWSLGLQSQKCILPQFWKPDDRNQDVGRLNASPEVLGETPFLASSTFWWLLASLAWGHITPVSASIFTLAFSSVPFKHTCHWI